MPVLVPYPPNQEYQKLLDNLTSEERWFLVRAHHLGMCIVTFQQKNVYPLMIGVGCQAIEDDTGELVAFTFIP